MTRPATQRLDGDRGVYWHDALWRTCPPATRAFGGRVRSCCIGDVRIASSTLGAVDVRWPDRLIADTTDRFLLMWVQRAGSAEIRQGGNRAVLAASDLTIIDAGAPYRIHMSPDCRSRMFRIPRNRFGSSQSSVTRLAGVPIFGASGSGRVVSSFLDALADEAGSRGELSPAFVGRGIGLVADLADELAAAADVTADGGELRARVVGHIDEHLGDPTLSVTGIARAHAVSVRSLQKVFALTGRTVTETIRHRRLETIREELERPGSRTRTIAAVARDFGYFDAPHFSRSFRRAYGLTPREWQQRAARRRGLPAR
jgi:AraC-like DNA-binding protein